MSYYPSNPATLSPAPIIMRKALEGSVSSLGDLKGRKIAFLGDTGFNMANSWILGASLFGMKISLGGPKGFEPSPEIRALLKDGFQGTFTLETHWRHPKGKAYATETSLRALLKVIEKV